MTDSTKKLLLIDGNSVAFRAFYALYNQVEKFTNHDGLHTNAIYSFKIMLDKLLKQIDPTNILVAFDAGRTTFRTEKYADYKGQRSKTPRELSEQFPFLREMLTDYGIKSYDLKNYEADDIIGTLAKEAEGEGFQITIVTGDRDLTQLATDQTTVAITKKGVSEIEKYTPEHIEEKFGLNPRQIIDMKGLVGDTSDNYPGVTKVGEKTAIKLLKKYGSIEGIYDQIDEMRQSKMKEHLIEDKEQAFMSKDLARIRQDAPIEVGIKDTEWSGIDYEKLESFYQQMDFNRFLSELHQNQGVANSESASSVAPIDYTELTAANLTELGKPDGSSITFHLEMDGENYHKAPIIGFAILKDDKYFVSNQPQLLKEPVLKELLENATLDVFNAKRNYVGLNRLGIQMAPVDFDLLLISYLLNNTDNSDDLGKLAHEHQYYQVQSDEDVYGKGAKRSVPVDQPEFLQHLAHKVQAIHDLKSQLMDELDAHEQTELYETIERPLSIVLAQMEIAGIKVDIDRLMQMRSEFKERLAEIEQQIYQEAGEEFNIGSPKQLGVILFEKLKLPVIKKTKTGYSTAVSVLEKLQGLNPIIDNILLYRQLSKLQSTYVEGLLKVVFKEDSKVHTRYTQTLTSTGRLSSVDPNLQNIPVRLEEGRKIRQAFVPSHSGWQIFSSDYSQIELRVLAHISGDENMQEAFKTGADIHASTAMKIFNLDSPDEVTPNMRRQAKAVNFGIVYGISDFGLAQNIGITRKAAKKFIETYFESFPGVHKYMTGIVELAKKQGYVETLFHRRRYLPEINSKNYNLRSFAERTAMNSPIQGSAADIIKIAMIRMQKMLREKGLKAKMLLQVHDELIFEAPKEEIPVLKELVPKVMDSAVDLAVPLKVESASGDTWFDAKK